MDTPYCSCQAEEEHDDDDDADDDDDDKTGNPAVANDADANKTARINKAGA